MQCRSLQRHGLNKAISIIGYREHREHIGRFQQQAESRQLARFCLSDRFMIKVNVTYLVLIIVGQFVVDVMFLLGIHHMFS